MRGLPSTTSVSLENAAVLSFVRALARVCSVRRTIFGLNCEPYSRTTGPVGATVVFNDSLYWPEHSIDLAPEPLYEAAPEHVRAAAPTAGCGADCLVSVEALI